MNHVVKIFICFLILVERFSFSQSYRKVVWDKVPGAIYYDGNIYSKESVVRVRTQQNHVYIPVKENIEVIAVKGFKNTLNLGVFRRKDLSNGNMASEDDDYYYFSYNDDPEIIPGEIAEAFDTESVFIKRSKSDNISINGKAIELLYDVFPGATITQEDVLSEGLIGRFEGKGVAIGAGNTIEGRPEEGLDATIFSFHSEVLSFTTESQQVIDGFEGSVRKQNTNMLRFVGDFVAVMGVAGESYFRMGLGLSWERLPFFDIKDESGGLGELTSRSSVGMSVVSQVDKKIGFGVVRLKASVLPISGNTKSLREINSDLRALYPISGDLGLFVSGMGRYQLIRFQREKLGNNSETQVFPKTINKSFRLTLGLTAKI